MANKIETNSKKNFKPRINLNHNMDIHAKVISGLGLEIVKWFCLLEEKNKADTKSFFPVIKINKRKKNKQLNSCRHFVVDGTGWQASDLTFNSLRPCPVIFSLHQKIHSTLPPSPRVLQWFQQSHYNIGVTQGWTMPSSWGNNTLNCLMSWNQREAFSLWALMACMQHNWLLVKLNKL